MIKYEELKQYVEDNELEDVLFFDSPSFSHSIVGISTDNRIIYSLNAMIKDLSQEWEISGDEALEFIEVNTLRTLPYYPNGPIVLEDLFFEEE